MIDANAQLIGDVATGRLLAHSVLMYRPKDSNSPDNGKWCLQHLGFLGGNPPVIKGLKRFVFGDKESTATLVFSVQTGVSRPGCRDPPC